MNQFTKYRPYLTLPEIEEIISSLSRTSQNIALLKYLKQYHNKISLSFISPNLTIAPRKDFIHSLELSPSTSSPIDYASLKKAAYDKWRINAASCSISELQLSSLYRYENDMMSPEEEKEYEAANN